MRIDLLLHFLLGYFIADLTNLLTPAWGGIITATIAGICKELWDKYHDKEKFDKLDLAATFAGGFINFWVALVQLSN